MQQSAKRSKLADVSQAPLIDPDKLRVAIDTRLAGRSLEEGSSESGIPTSTLHRCRHGYVPGLETYARLCGWLGLSMDYFRREVAS